MPTSLRPAAGFTLIELLTVLALLTLLLMLATPSFISVRRNSQLVTTTNSFLASLNTARTEAMKRGIYTYVIPLSGQDWTSGWLIYADNDRSQTFTAGDAEIYRQPAMPHGITVDNSGGKGYRGFLVDSERYVSFNRSGYPRTNDGGGGFLANRLVFTNGDSRENRTVVLAPSGRVRICKVGETACLADDN